MLLIKQSVFKITNTFFYFFFFRSGNVQQLSGEGVLILNILFSLITCSGAFIQPQEENSLQMDCFPVLCCCLLLLHEERRGRKRAASREEASVSEVSEGRCAT